MNKYIGKIIIVTNMRKIPRSCAECGYYDGMGNRPRRALQRRHLHGGRVDLQYTRHSGNKRTAEKLPAAHDREG